MKLTQFWRNGQPALGLWTDRGILDVAAEATRKGCTVPGTMAAALPLGGEALNRLLKPLLEDVYAWRQTATQKGCLISSVFVKAATVWCGGLLLL